MPMTLEQQQETRAKEVLEELRPYLQADGGDVAYERREDPIVYIRLKGARGVCVVADAPEDRHRASHHGGDSRDHGGRGRLMPVARRLAITALVWLLTLVTTGCSVQRRLYYFPKDYDQSRLDAFDAVGTRIEYWIDGKSQTSFYIPPEVAPPAGTAPRLWVICSGQASLALDWFDYVREAPVDDAGFLLIDYPGYGLSEGSPSRERIVAALDSAWLALAGELDVGVEQLDRDVNLMGFSMGTATGLEFATRRPVRRVVLLAPFTSLLDMARLRVPIVAESLLDRYDNKARLDELAARSQAPSILVLHGDADGVVPFRMGREMGGRHPAITRFVAFEGIDHTTLPKAAREIIYEEFATAAPACGAPNCRLPVAPRSGFIHSTSEPGIVRSPKRLREAARGGTKNSCTRGGVTTPPPDSRGNPSRFGSVHTSPPHRARRTWGAACHPTLYPTPLRWHPACQAAPTVSGPRCRGR